MIFDSQDFGKMRPGDVYKDDRVKGLQLRRREETWNWQLYYRLDGVVRRPKLADWPTFDLQAARKIARDMLEKVAVGIDPLAARTARREAPTVAELASLYLEHLQWRVDQGDFGRLTLKEYARHIRKDLEPALGRLKVADVTHTDAEEVLGRVAKARGLPTANRVRATLSGLFTFAEHPDRAFRQPHTNPARATILRPEKRRSRVGTVEECAAAFQALLAFSEHRPAHVAALITICLAGTRITELITAPRSSLHGDVLVLDEHKNKRTGEPRIIYLPRQAMQLIASLPDDGSGLIFGTNIDRWRVRDTWIDACRIAEVEGLTARDLRRTFASAALNRGTSLDQLAQILGHGDPRTTRRYAWLAAATARRAVQGAADGLSAIEPPAALGGLAELDLGEEQGI